MATYHMFLFGCCAVCAVTMVVNVLLKGQPKKADMVVDYIFFISMFVMISYAITVTDWLPVEQKLSKDLNDLNETHRRVWNLN